MYPRRRATFCGRPQKVARKWQAAPFSPLVSVYRNRYFKLERTYETFFLPHWSDIAVHGRSDTCPVPDITLFSLFLFNSLFYFLVKAKVKERLGFKYLALPMTFNLIPLLLRKGWRAKF